MANTRHKIASLREGFDDSDYYKFTPDTTIRELIEVAVKRAFQYYGKEDLAAGAVLADKELMKYLVTAFWDFNFNKEYIEYIKDEIEKEAVKLHAVSTYYDYEGIEDSCMTFKEFKDELRDYDEDSPIVVSSGNHAYGSIDADSFYESEDGKYCFINVDRSTYSIEGCVSSNNTVAKILEEIEDEFDDDASMVFVHDNGYTYGACNEDSFYSESYIPEVED